MKQELVVKIENKEGVNVVSSRVVAEQLGKQHKHVLEALRKLAVETSATKLFINSEYENRGKMYPEILLTKDGFTLYMFNIQGYNDFKMAYINKFNEMEKALNTIGERERLLLGLFSNDHLIVANSHKLLVELEKKPLLEKIEKDRPKVEIMDSILEEDKYFDGSQLSKMLNNGMGRNKIFEFLRENRVLRSNNEPYQKFVDNGCCKLVVTKTKNGIPKVKPVFSMRMVYWIQKKLGIK